MNETLHQTPIEVQPAEKPEQERSTCDLETDSYPHTVRFKKSIGWVAEAKGQLSAGSGEGQSMHKRGLEYVRGLEREAVSNQAKRLPDVGTGRELDVGLTASPPGVSST